MKSSNPNSGCRAVEIAKCIDTTYPDPSKNQGGIAIVQPAIAMATQQGGAEIAENLCPTITAAAGMSGNNQPVIALQANGIDRADTAGCNGCGWRENESYTLNGAISVDASHADDAVQETYTMQRSDEYQECNVASTQSARQYKSATDLVVEKKRKYIIRRLTPTECARLQGFPDKWGHLAPYNPADAEFWEDVRKTHAEINGKKYKPVKDIRKWYDKLHTDSAEYKMWGNGIALPNAEYVIHGIAEQGAKTLGSLFDGSGGFPLAGAMNGIKPLWASEVEPYPIAVTKSRFKEEQE
jgi:DNA (cytosine-5)-methyltransferase 1